MALIAIYLAILGIAVFFVAFHSLRMQKALELVSNEAFTLTMIAEYHRLAFGRELTKEEEAAVERKSMLRKENKQKEEEVGPDKKEEPTA